MDNELKKYEKVKPSTDRKWSSCFQKSYQMRKKNWVEKPYTKQSAVLPPAYSNKTSLTTISSEKKKTEQSKEEKLHET